MVFNSVTFILFLIIVVILYWALPNRAKGWMLLIASCVFYGFWKWEYLGIIFLSAVVDYWVSNAIYNTPEENKSRRKKLLAVSLTVNLGLLCYFKYLIFITTNLNEAFAGFGLDYQFTLYNIILPFGISFYTFETISYTVDVYRGLIKPEKKLVDYGLFVLYFPKLVAGPIQRASELLVQLKNKPAFKAEFLEEGLKRIMYGLFLKVALADNISPIVDEGFATNPDILSAIDVWTLAFLFGFQIYFDFSAYSHIAVGASKLMGITIPENFNYPYISSSFKDFWKRWHISLSSWIRDYMYLPLSGIKVRKTTGTGGIAEGLETTAKANKDRALFLTWAIMGLWHGANWTFVVWGVYHSIVIYAERKLKPVREKIPFFNYPLVGWAITLPLAMLSWIPFRAETLTSAFTMMGKVFVPSNYMFRTMRENNYLITALLLVLFLITYFVDKKLSKYIEKLPPVGFVLNCLKYVVLIIIIFTFLRPITQFIYFQF